METTTEKETVQMPMRYSGFWVRLAAHIIDGFVISTVSLVFILPLSIVLSIFTAMDDTHIAEILVQIVISMISMLLTWAYYIFMTHKYQATLGKMAIGARVSSEDGQRLTIGNVILRETVGKLASAFTLCIGYFMVGFTQKKQGLHDIITKSVVTYTDEGPRKIVVGLVYGFYALIMVGILCLIGLLVFLGFMIGTSGENSSDYQYEYDMQEQGDDMFNDGINSLIKDMSDQENADMNGQV